MLSVVLEQQTELQPANLSYTGAYTDTMLGIFHLPSSMHHPDDNDNVIEKVLKGVFD